MHHNDLNEFDSKGFRYKICTFHCEIYTFFINSGWTNLTTITYYLFKYVIWFLAMNLWIIAVCLFQLF